jgi:hypothetical protein
MGGSPGSEVLSVSEEQARARRRVSAHVWRVAADVPVVLLGEPSKVRAVEGELRDKLSERSVVSTDVWVRTDGDGAGQRHALVKRSLVILYGVGDIDRAKVCTITPVHNIMT